MAVMAVAAVGAVVVSVSVVVVALMAVMAVVVVGVAVVARSLVVVGVAGVVLGVAVPGVLLVQRVWVSVVGVRRVDGRVVGMGVVGVGLVVPGRAVRERLGDRAVAAPAVGVRGVRAVPRRPRHGGSPFRCARAGWYLGDILPAAGASATEGTLRKPQHSLAEQAYGKIKQDLIRCHFRPGSVLRESDLADRYGMSKTPVREALTLLRREGFIDVLPRRGTLVRRIELEDVQNTFLLRAVLEPEAAALAATRATRERLKRVSDAADAIARPRPGASAHERLRLHRAFHEAIAEASGIADLAGMIRSLHEKVEWFYNYERGHASDQGEPASHAALAEAIVAGDAAEARRLIAESIRASRKQLVDALIREPQEAPALVRTA